MTSQKIEEADDSKEKAKKEKEKDLFRKRFCKDNFLVIS